ncbi:hypothetical protein EXN22_16230 [Pseudomonas tructae]|uniref:Uncharacterized protein n=1 Tax=Pseudomonas tructae TaxID=2518644 RepID=A0A411MK47_9PSED|nr:hypothetical protein [Pseudomonas tructae]QBF27162.1 hypothetical protein EXN22_16230 [Pseudomonas tructae]
MSQQYIGTKQLTAWPESKDGVQGYGVRYADGYTSWSPKGPFEAAYRPMGDVKHLTAEQQAVVGEHVQLNDQLIKLGLLIDSPAYKQLSLAEQMRLASQRVAAGELLRIIATRIAEFGGDA